MSHTYQSYQSGLNPVIIILALLLPLSSGCSSSDSPAPAPTTTTYTAALDTSVKNVPLTAGVPVQVKFTYTAPKDVTSKGAYSINLAQTLQNVTLSSTPVASITNTFETLRFIAYALIKEAFAAESTTVTTYISYAGDPDVCSSPYNFGPITVMGAIGSELTSDTDRVVPDQAAADITQAGAFEICVVTTPPVDGYVTLSGVSVDFEACAEPSGDYTGIWAGTYQCTNFGTQSDSGEITLHILKEPDGSYTYYDSNAEYSGHICGNRFRFNGGAINSYSESGTMVFNGDNATKSSSWVSTTSSTIGGRCSDILQRVPG
jgi:hypothetical protein